MRSSRRGVLPLATLAALAILAAGCGRSAASGAPGSTASRTPSLTTTPAQPTSAAPPAAADPCILVSKMDAETLAGTTLQDAVKIDQTCTYTAPPSGPTAQVQIFVGDGAKKFLDTDRQLNHTFTQLSGIGDEAWIEPGVVFINKSGQWVCIVLVRLDDPAVYRTKFEALARAVAGRM